MVTVYALRQCPARIRSPAIGAAVPFGRPQDRLFSTCAIRTQLGGRMLGDSPTGPRGTESKSRKRCNAGENLTHSPYSRHCQRAKHCWSVLLPAFFLAPLVPVAAVVVVVETE